MRSYIPTTREEQQAMLASIGLSGMEDLLRDIPESVRLQRPLNLAPALSEAEVLGAMRSLAEQNTRFRGIFRGAGAYHHLIPSIIQPLVERGEFLTAYTPYQFEISQGMLQAIFEYQSLIARLTGMDASNASVYDGATAAVEAMLICRDKTRKRTFLASQGLSPDVLSVLKTYAPGAGIDLLEIPDRDGEVDLKALSTHVADAAGFLMATPNYHGLLQTLPPIAELVHAARGLLVVYAEPISLGLLKKPGHQGADIVVGDGQPLGIPLSFGGPYVGFMAAKQALLRNLPGRIVGETVDDEGTRAYVLTLQAREQHIRREKATSNICSNQSLCAIMAAIYMTAMGPQGMREVAMACTQKAHYLAERITAIPGMRLAYDKPFFMEFVVESEIPAPVIDEALRKKSILGGLPLDEHRILYCATEANSREEIEELVKALEEIK